jgi:hypothetical protein
MTDEELLEEKWGRVLVHESGHALMAVLKGIHCHGIYYDRTANQFCALTDPTPEPEHLKKHYMCSAAGAAAELVIYGNRDEEDATSDRSAFQGAGAPSFQDTLNEAQALLRGSEGKLRRLVSKLKSKCLQVDLDLGALPEVGLDGSDHKFAVLMPRDELESVLRS